MLIDSTALRTMIAELRQHYTWVVLACPAVTDAAAIADASDMVVLAVRKGVTTDEQLRQTSTLLPDTQPTCAVLFDRSDHPEPNTESESDMQTKAHNVDDEDIPCRRQAVLEDVCCCSRGGILLSVWHAILLAPTKFVSTTQLMVSIEGSTTAAAYQNDEVVAGRINSYIALLTSDVVNQRVIDRLGLPLTAPELAAKVSATNVPPKTAVIDVAVTDESPAQARLLANTLATEFINYAEALETPTGEDGQTVHTTVVTAASEPREQRFERILLGALAAVAALVLGAVAVWIRSRTDPVVRTADRAAAAAGVPVIGCVTFGIRWPPATT